MSIRRLRPLLVAMLIALVPLQGLAALSVGICRDLERSQEQSGNATGTAYTHSHDAHMGAANGSTQDPEAPGEHHNAHCAACVSCGLSTGIVALTPHSMADAPSDGVIAHRTSRFPGFVADRLDRPPLTPLA